MVNYSFECLSTFLSNPSFIPEGNNIFVHTYSLHRDPRYFSPLPDSFWPDRWLPERDRRSASSPSEFIHDLVAFQPFSFGPDNCVGKNLALQQLRALVCFMVQRFDFTLGEGCELESWEDNIEDYFVMKRPPIPVVLQVRQWLVDLYFLSTSLVYVCFFLWRYHILWNKWHSYWLLASYFPLVCGWRQRSPVW